MQIELKYRQMPHAIGLELPSYQTEGAAGLDLLAALPKAEPLIIQPRARKLVPTGLVLQIPLGFEGQVRPRLGLALKHGISVLNTPGTIDSDYRGEISVLLINFGDTDYAVMRGARIAQLILAPIAFAVLVAVEMIEATKRGEAGYGSTGILSNKS